MYCPYCSQTETKVLESRLVQDSIRRRRECLHCTNRFTTYERAMMNLKVIKRDGREQEFDLNKIKLSLAKACDKVEAEVLDDLTRKIEQKIRSKRTNLIKTTEIGKIVLQELRKFDQMAYLRFASVYKSIDDPKLLKKELNTIIKNR